MTYLPEPYQKKKSLCICAGKWFLRFLPEIVSKIRGKKNIQSSLGLVITVHCVLHWLVYVLHWLVYVLHWYVLHWLAYVIMFMWFSNPVPLGHHVLTQWGGGQKLAILFAHDNSWCAYLINISSAIKLSFVLTRINYGTSSHEILIKFHINYHLSIVFIIVYVANMWE